MRVSKGTERTEMSRNHKYNAKKTMFDGIQFDSQKEAFRYGELKLLERAGEIAELELQPRFLLQEGFTDSKGKRRRKIEYVADFQYIENGKIVVEDSKGFKTDVFKIKEKLLLKKYPEIDFRLS